MAGEATRKLVNHVKASEGKSPSTWDERRKRTDEDMKDMTEDEKFEYALDRAPQVVPYPAAGMKSTPVKTIRGTIRGYRRGLSTPQEVTSKEIDAYVRRAAQRNKSAPSPEDTMTPGEISARSRTEELKKMLPKEVLNRKWEPNPAALGETTTGTLAKEPPRGYGSPVKKEPVNLLKHYKESKGIVADKPYGNPRRYIQKEEASSPSIADEPKKVYSTDDVIDRLMDRRLKHISDSSGVTGRNFNKNVKPVAEPEEAALKVKNAKAYDELGVKMKARGKNK